MSVGSRAVNGVRWRAQAVREGARKMSRTYLPGPVVGSLGGFVARYYRGPSIPARAKPRVLILRYGYYALDRREPSHEGLFLDNTLRASGIADPDVMTYDCDFGVSPYSDLQLIRRCSETRPDLVVLSSWWWRPTHPSLHALRLIREQLGIPVAALWWDTCNRTFWPTLAPYIGEFDLHVVCDNPRGHRLDKSHPLFDRFLFLWTPMDPSLCYVEDESARTIPLSFFGSLGSYRASRREYLEHLSAQGVEGHFWYPDQTGHIPATDYAAIVRRSQMCLNFSSSVDDHQLKGRVFETLHSGALLLESENDQTSLLFTPMEDYVPFSSKEDLLEKIRFLQAHPDQMRAIARRGSEKARTHYSSEGFWRAIFSRVGLDAVPSRSVSR